MTAVKRLHEIVLKDVILLDATKRADSLKKYWFVPLWLYRKQLEILVAEIFRLIGNDPIESVEDQFDKLLAYRKLQMLEALYQAVIIEMFLKSKINAYKIIFSKDIKESDQFEEVVSEVLKLTGIKLETPESITELRQYIEHKTDKYKEMFPEKVKDEDETDKTVSLIDVINSVFVFMGQPINRNMPLTDFVSLRKLAEERVRKQSNNLEEDGQQ